jgi:hypothetical protein
MKPKAYSEKLSRLLSFNPRITLQKMKEFKMSQSARSQYLAKVKSEQAEKAAKAKAEQAEKTAKAKADSFQEAMDMAQAVIDDARQKEKDMSYTPGLGRMDVFKAYVKRTVRKFKRAVRNLVVVRRIEKIQTDVKSHFRKYKTVYIAVPVSVAVGAAIVFGLTRKGGLGSLKGVDFTKFTFTNLSNDHVGVMDKLMFTVKCFTENCDCLVDEVFGNAIIKVAENTEDLTRTVAAA